MKINLPKCIVIGCGKLSNHGICPGHIEKILNKDYVVLVCQNCVTITKIINRKYFVDYYLLVKSCRNCTDDSSGETIIVERKDERKLPGRKPKS